MSKPIEQYTEQEIDALQAGRETDALVAVSAFGWYFGPVRDKKWIEQFPNIADVQWELCAPDGRFWHIPQSADWVDWFNVERYSTDIRAAWLVVEKIKDIASQVDISTFSPHLPSGYTCYIHGYNSESWIEGKLDDDFSGEANTTSLAICKAALKAVRAMKLREVA